MALVKDRVNSFMLRTDVSLPTEMFLCTSGVYSRHKDCIILQFVRRVMSISRAVTCVTTETLKNGANHQGSYHK